MGTGSLEKQKPAAFKISSQSIKIYLIMGGILLVAGIVVGVNRPVFFSLANVQNILLMTSAAAIMSFGLTFILIAGGIDIGMPMVMMLGAVVCGLTIQRTGSIVLGFGALFLVGLTCGSINGFLISRCKMLPFITTLVMQYISNGTAVLLAQSRTIPLPEFFGNLNRLVAGIIPLPVLLMIVTGVIMHIILTRTQLGRTWRAIGLNRSAADTCGLRTTRATYLAYMIGGLMTSLAAIVMMSRLGTVSLMMVTESTGLDVICAAIVGGASIYGGSGTILGAFFGALLISTIQNIINLFGLDTFTMYLIKGCIILLCTYLDAVKTRIRRNG